MSNKRPSKSTLCTYTFSNGNSCRMLAHPDHGGLCYHHATSNPSDREDDLAFEFAETGEGEFISAIDINHAVGCLFQALAENRISPRRAMALANVARILLKSQRDAIKEAEYWPEESEMQRRILRIKFPGTYGDFYPPSATKKSNAPHLPLKQSEPHPETNPEPELDRSPSEQPPRTN